ncbi:MAG: caspase family protein [Nostocales cyanobacterium 94392]|nr:caspase family protein [Nostocales cyanobacterium 94392]
MESSTVENHWAFLVGVNRYIDKNFGRLKFCVNDVKALEQILTEVGYQVVCLHDELNPEDHRFPTRDNIEAELKGLCSQIAPNDLLWVHFACHGTQIDKGNGKEPVLIARDTRQHLLETRSLPVAEVEKIMKGSGAKRLILTLDACHTGIEIGRDLTDPEFIKNVHDLAEGFALIAASTAEQKAFELKDKQHGVFTYYLLQGLVNSTNSRGNFVTVKDLEHYVLNELRKWNVKESLTQEPTARTEGLGDIILADYRQYSQPELQGLEETASSSSDGSKLGARDDSTSNKLSRVKLIEKQELEAELEGLSEQYTAVNKQRNQIIDERHRLLYKKQADDLLNQMKEVEVKLQQLD